MTATQPAIFVSYAHEDSALAHAFAQQLQSQGARVWLDQGELLIGDSLIERISEAIAEFDFVAALVSEHSVQSNWCRKEIALAMSKGLKRGARSVTVLPLRVGDVEMPPSLVDMKWQPLDRDSLAEAAGRVAADAVRHLERQLPAVGRPRVARSQPVSAQGVSAQQGPTKRNAANDEAVKIIAVDTNGIGQPKNDHTRGSALYRIPLVLNRVPPPEWAHAFPAAWNSPPAWTSMHRPGIASVSGDRIILDGTTIEELEKYHLETLKLVVRQLNQALVEHRAREQAKEEARRQAQQEHEQRVQDTVRRLRFEDDE